MDTTDWETLVARARAEQPHAMEDLLAAVRPLVVRRCAKFLPYRQDAEEAAQEALLTIATRLHDFTGRGSFVGWVTVIASNQALQTYRSMKKRFNDTTADAVGERPDPRTTSVIAGTRLDLLDALDALRREHPTAVEAFVLRDLGSLPYDEIAALTGAPVGTVKARIHTARGYVARQAGLRSGWMRTGVRERATFRPVSASTPVTDSFEQENGHDEEATSRACLGSQHRRRRWHRCAGQCVDHRQRPFREP
ncbi:RNA polymerase sigma factor [Aeromicrobium sp. UC242_57]|uniref:RNA polymerase sigma factor n=1 Tax=Aeromicrobium sp. UC242_57 TaxID=3374624 RepID=UPI00378E4527